MRACGARDNVSRTHRHRVMVFIVQCKLARTRQPFNCGGKNMQKTFALATVHMAIEAAQKQKQFVCTEKKRIEC